MYDNHSADFIYDNLLDMSSPPRDMKSNFIDGRIGALLLEAGKAEDGSWWAYIGVDKENPFYGKDCLDEKISSLDVTGGVIYTEKDTSINGARELWFIGFSYFDNSRQFDSNLDEEDQIKIDSIDSQIVRFQASKLAWQLLGKPIVSDDVLKGILKKAASKKAQKDF
ncbi:MAG: hypothetical protein ACJAS1_000825 [Oleiphilaceae bacterium]|jgi:hypothetical protein